MTLVLIFLAIGIAMTIIIGLEFIFIYFVMYRRFKKISLVLGEEGIIYNNAKGEVSIPYENVIALKFPAIKYMGGWVKIKHPNGNIRLTVVLEGIGDMIKCLKNKLDERNMSSIYDEKAMYKFFKTGEYSDQSWERIYEIIKYLFIIIIINLGVTTIFSAFIAEIPIKILATTVSIIGPAITFIISEIIFGRRLAKGASRENFSVPKRDKVFEIKVYKWVLGIYSVIYFIFMILILFLK